jgi:hypothetical protein
MKTDDPRKPDALIVAYYGSYTVGPARNLQPETRSKAALAVLRARCRACSR